MARGTVAVAEWRGGMTAARRAVLAAGTAAARHGSPPRSAKSHASDAAANPVSDGTAAEVLVLDDEQREALLLLNEDLNASVAPVIAGTRRDISSGGGSANADAHVSETGSEHARTAGEGERSTG